MPNVLERRESSVILMERRASSWSEFGPGESELTNLKHVEDAHVVDNTRMRYEAGHIYSRSGRLLLAVNPYRLLPLYTPEVLSSYQESLQPQAELPPHVYAVAASAHLGMLQNGISQVCTDSESTSARDNTSCSSCFIVQLSSFQLLQLLLTQ